MQSPVMLNTLPPLPAGFEARPATIADIPACAAMFNAVSIRLIGHPSTTETELRSEWSEPGYDISTSTRLILAPNSDIAAYQEIWSEPPYVTIQAWGRTHPNYANLGLGTHLLAWAEQSAQHYIDQAEAETAIRLRAGALDIDTAAKNLLKANNFQIARYFLRMVIDFDTTTMTPPPAWPEGLRWQTFDRNTELRSLAIAVRESFEDHYGYVETPLDEDLRQWSHELDNTENFDPSLYFLLWDGDAVAGFCLCRQKSHDDPDLGWVTMLGVRRPWRKRGLARTMLLHAFAELRRRGQSRVGLVVDADSLTGATRLYTGVGMQSDPRFQRISYVKMLRDGVDLMRQ